MKSLLFVDDEPNVARVARRALERAGYDVTVARDGEEGLERMRETSFDVVITDIQMPRMDGREMCAKMLEEFPDRKPILFVITSRSEFEFREWTDDLPQCEFIHKPLSLRHVLERLEHHLGTQP